MLSYELFHGYPVHNYYIWLWLLFLDCISSASHSLWLEIQTWSKRSWSKNFPSSTIDWYECTTRLILHIISLINLIVVIFVKLSYQLIESIDDKHIPKRNLFHDFEWHVNFIWSCTIHLLHLIPQTYLTLNTRGCSTRKIWSNCFLFILHSKRTG